MEEPMTIQYIVTWISKEDEFFNKSMFCSSEKGVKETLKRLEKLKEIDDENRYTVSIHNIEGNGYDYDGFFLDRTFFEAECQSIHILNETSSNLGTSKILIMDPTSHSPLYESEVDKVCIKSSKDCQNFFDVEVDQIRTIVNGYREMSTPYNSVDSKGFEVKKGYRPFLKATIKMINSELVLIID
jgi:hypothetical protein